MRGLVIDSTILISCERSRVSAVELLRRIETKFGPVDLKASTITAVELFHGVSRATDVTHRARRQAFLDDIFKLLAAVPFTFEIAKRAGEIEGERAAAGIIIPFEDLLIGSTALHLGFDILTFNTKHFELIPDLKVHSL